MSTHVKSTWDRNYCVDIVNLEKVWSRYPMWALLNMKINDWSLNRDIPEEYALYIRDNEEELN